MLTCRFLSSSIIDRTLTLDQGFDYVVFDPIPEPAKNGATFAELCDTIGGEIVAEANASERNIAKRKKSHTTFICHSERNEESLPPRREIPRFSRNDK